MPIFKEIINSHDMQVTALTKFSIGYDGIKPKITEAYIAVGMITDDMYGFFMRSVPKNAAIQIVTGIHLPTSTRVLASLKEKSDKGELKAGVFIDNFFHPKLYLFRLQNEYIAYVGSGNFTRGGWHENEELFVQVTDQQACIQLKERFDDWLARAHPITQRFLDLYMQTFTSNVGPQIETKKNIKQLIDNLSNVFNIDNVDFTGQFFSKEHHLAFAPGITHLDTPEVLAGRTEVVNRLHQLNEMLEPHFPNWNIHSHYRTENIVSGILTQNHHNENVRGLLMAYGRSYQDLKQYGESATPLTFMRLQVIIHYDSVGIWLMPGKVMGGEIDREYFKEKMKDPVYQQQFYQALKLLGEGFWIEVADDMRSVASFNSVQELATYVKKDNWRHFYFTIGRNYPLGSEQLKEMNLVQTILQDFKKLYPLYELIKHPFTVKGALS